MIRQLTNDAAEPFFSPAYGFAWALLTYALLTLLLGYPALQGQFLVNPASDQYIAGYAFREFGASYLRQQAEFPLWNPYLFGGVPFVAGMGGDIFYPSFLLRLFLPTDVAMTWTFMLHLFAAGVFTYGFLRAWGLGFMPALLGGAAYMLSGQIASLVSPGHDGKLFVSALFPFALWMVLLAIRDGRPWAYGLGALAVGLGVLSPHPQLLQYMLLGSGAFAVYVAFAAHGGARLPRNVALTRLGIAIGFVLVGMLLGAIQFLPVREYVDWSPRAGGKGYDYATSFSMPPEELVNTYLPEFSGILDRYWGRNPLKLHGEYMGAVVLLVAGAAFGWTRRRSFRLFWTVTLVVAVLWALGGYTPFYRLVYELVPGSKFFRAPSTIFFIASFAVAVLAALGLERIQLRQVGRRYMIGWGTFAAFMTLLAISGALSSFGAGLTYEVRYDAALTNRGNVVAGGLRSLVFVAAALSVIVALSARRLGHVAAGAALIALAAADLWLVGRRYWMFSPPAEQLYASDAALEYVKAQDQPGRVLAIQLGADAAPHDPFLNGDGLMVHRIRTVLGYHGNELGRYQTLYGKSLGGQEQLSRILANPNFMALTNMRFVLTNIPELPVAGVTPVLGPVRNAAGTETWLYRTPGDNPFAWVAPLIVAAPDDAVLSTVLDPRFDVRRAALFDTSARVTPVSDVQALPEPLNLQARITRHEPERISVELERAAPAGSALVVAENYYPGWTATADGREARVGRTDYTLIGVELPEGARRVELTFRSRPYEVGRTVTLVVLAMILLSVVGGILLDRRRRV